MDTNEQLKRIREPVIQAARRILNTPDGKTLIDALEKCFPFVVEKTSVGAVDANAALVLIGNRQVVEQMKKWAEITNGGQGT